MQLIRITTVPAQLQMNSQLARLQYKTTQGGFTLSKQGGSLEMYSRSIRQQMNSDNFRSSLGIGSHTDTMDKSVQRARQAAQEGVARSVDMGNQMLRIDQGTTIPDILFFRMMQDAGRGTLTFVPLSPINMGWIEPELSMNYRPVKQSFEWETAKNVLEYIPGKFSVEVKQYPEVRIEYLGGPNYVPPSAAPKP